MIALRGVHKEYPRTGFGLRDVNLEVGKGEFCLLTGPSGAGKSTLLRLIIMAERPTAGEVWVAGYSSRTIRRRDIARVRRRLGMIFQDFQLLPSRTIEENVAFALEVTGASRAIVRARVMRLLAMLGLSNYRDSLPAELSGGGQQKVAIARALANDPLVLLADEPTGNLDSASAHEILQILTEINALGTAVILASHDAGILPEGRAKVVRLQNGQVVGVSPG